MPKKIPNFINGEFITVKTENYTNVYNSATGEIVAQLPETEIEDVRYAIERAQKAFISWADTPVSRRSRVLFKFRELLELHLDELGEIAAIEHGKTWEDAKTEVSRGIEITEFACGMPHLLKGDISYNVGTGVDGHNLRQPLGVVCGIAPFNFPAMIPMWMAPIAIAAGNSFVLKPSSEVPSLSIKLAELWKEAGLPAGVFTIVNGGRAVATEFTENPLVQAVSFVGSSSVAQLIYRNGAANGKRVQALGAAKNHAIVMPDADLEFTANNIMGAAFGSAGERCMALPIVVCIGDKIADALIKLLSEKIKNLKVGAYNQPNVDMGPLISKSHQEKVINYITTGVDKDKAKLLIDGRKLTIKGYENGYFVGPTLFDYVTTQMVIYKEEIFGPVLGIMRAKDYDEALKWTNEHEFGNGAVIFTRDGNTARLFTQDVKAGMVGINVPIPAPSALYSFGGWKASLFGDHHMYGEEGVRFYTRLKTVTTRWPAGVPSGENSFIMPTN